MINQILSIIRDHLHNQGLPFYGVYETITLDQTHDKIVIRIRKGNVLITKITNNEDTMHIDDIAALRHIIAVVEIDLANPNAFHLIDNAITEMADL